MIESVSLRQSIFGSQESYSENNIRKLKEGIEDEYREEYRSLFCKVISRFDGSHEKIRVGEIAKALQDRVV